MQQVFMLLHAKGVADFGPSASGEANMFLLDVMNTRRVFSCPDKLMYNV